MPKNDALAQCEELRVQSGIRQLRGLSGPSSSSRVSQRLLARWARLRRAARVWRAKQLGVKCGSDLRLGQNIVFSLGMIDGRSGEIAVADKGWLEDGVVLSAYGGNINLCRSVYLGQYVIIYGHGGVEIGEETLIAMHTCIMSSNHEVPARSKIIRQQSDVLLPTKIGKDVWIGANACILGGVTIGDGCVVGAGAVVTKDLPPYSIAVGVPARVVSYRD